MDEAKEINSMNLLFSKIDELTIDDSTFLLNEYTKITNQRLFVDNSKNSIKHFMSKRHLKERYNSASMNSTIERLKEYLKKKSEA